MCNKIALLEAFDGLDNIVICETGINLDMSRSSIQNALSEMNDN